ncbi:hypothetical protein SCHPADRAFT_947894 [Schizopora paradoxa]|uniref:BAH domain-containing protein n=1 Tax=Schizopora paradoxa TaxID=27342 RepID=A0A0H2QZ06_9AGAM|nr:hypothetical protein SCHPADRAFT_947894 [Schizopora paradoxa]
MPNEFTFSPLWSIKTPPRIPLKEKRASAGVANESETTDEEMERWESMKVYSRFQIVLRKDSPKGQADIGDAVPESKKGCTDAAGRNDDDDDDDGYTLYLPNADDAIEAIVDEHCTSCVIKVGDMVQASHTGYDPNIGLDPAAYWIAQVDEIRAPVDDPNNVSLLVRWLIHPSYASLTGEDAPVSLWVLQFGVREVLTCDRIIGSCEFFSSNFEQVIHWVDIEKITRAIKVDESDIENEAVTSYDYYFRYHYDAKEKKLLTRPVQFCVCRESYDPDTDVMHYCAKCKDFFHSRCSTVTPSPVPSSSAARILDFALERTLVFPSSYSHYADLPHFANHYDNVPQSLLDLARTPAMRGGEHGVTGNVAAVGHARLFLADKIIRGVELSDDWARRAGIDEKLLDEYTVKNPDVRFNCPKCGSQI